MMQRRISLIVTAGLIAVILAIMVGGMLGSQQANLPAPRQLTLARGEYSVDGGNTWFPLEAEEPMRSSHGDMILRGRPDAQIPQGSWLNIHLKHMGLETLVNGAKVFSWAADDQTIGIDYCAEQWVSLQLPALSGEDVLEFRISPRYVLGLQGADCRHLAENLYLAEPFVLNQWLEDQNLPHRLFGLLLLMIGVILMGVALAAVFMKSPLGRILLFTALLAIGEGAYWTFSAAAIVSNIGDRVILSNLAISMSRVLVAYALMAGIAELLRRRSAGVSQWVACGHGLLCAGFLAFSLLTSQPFCRYELIWCGAQIPFIVAMLALCIPEFREKKYTVRHRFFIMAHMLAFAALLFSFVDRALGGGTWVYVEKGVCGVMTLCYALALFFQTPASHEAIQNAKRMSEELNQNRIVLAMSQIRTHFIFNVLNAISSLCKSDPDQADVELVRFARYLRTNIDIMQEDKPIPFEQEMDHVQNYVDLEQLRFNERIMIEENYEVTDFSLPSLIIQPLVENAIKHGLLPKAEGGLIRLSTYRQGQEVVIEIADDGVGFNARSRSTHNSVGLSNVRFRVEKMAGGRMEIKSRPDEGTVVKVILPYRKEMMV